VPLGQYEDIADYLEKLEAGAGRRYLKSKVLFAETIIPYLEMANIISVFDFADRLKEVIDRIQRWNGLEADESSEQPSWAPHNSSA